MIYLIRHGQTELNHLKLIQGRSDHPLNEKGIAQARVAAEKLNAVSFDAVYSSPLIRAVQTAKIVAPYAEPLVDERLIDMDYGPFEGKGRDALPPEVAAYFRDYRHTPVPEGMEHIGDVALRARAFLEERCAGGGDILVATHAIVMRGLLEYLAPEAAGGFWPGHMRNCTVYTAERLPGGAWSVRSFYEPEVNARRTDEPAGRGGAGEAPQSRST